LSAAGVVSYSLSGWLDALAAATATNPQRKRACILLWMNGGPSQMDTFDLKPGHANGGPYKEIATSVPGIKISEHLPKLARHAKDMVLVRSMSTPEGEHTRATFHMRTGYLPNGPIAYPTLGSLVSQELGESQSAIPNFVSIAPAPFLSPAAYEPGFLGPKFAPLMVGNTGYGFGPMANYEQALKVQDMARARDVSKNEADARNALRESLGSTFVARHPGLSTQSHKAAYERALRLMRTSAAKAFELDQEAPALRDAYGRNVFGQGCLLARRLVERGVPFVEVTLTSADGNMIGWDTHIQNFEMVKKLSAVLDPAWSTLMHDLKERGLLDTTLIVWMGEFGRTHRINAQVGRDHFSTAWTTVLAGGGIKGGQVYGKTSPDGGTVADKPVSVPNFMATIVKALGIDPTKQNMSNVGRPIRIADAGSKPLEGVVA
jgi:hypothetical protein